MNAGELLGAIAAGVAIASASGVVLSRIWAARHLGLMQAYEANNDELTRRVTLLEGHVERCEKELEAQRFANVEALGKGVAAAIQAALTPVLADIKDELRGVADAQDAQAVGIGRLVAVTSGLQNAVAALDAHLERRAPTTQREGE